MTGQTVGYIRVSTLDQNTVRQLEGETLDRNLGDLRAIVRRLTEMKAQVQFVHENLTFTGDDSPMATLMLSVMAAFAEFERSLIRERQREGIALTKARGVYNGRRKALTAAQASEMVQRAAMGVPNAQLARELSINREAVYQ